METPTDNAEAMNQSLSKPSFARFLATGALCFALNLGVLWFMVEICGVHYLAAMLVSILAVNGGGFLLNRRFTFAAQATDFWPELRRYFTVNLGAFALNLGLMAFLVDGLKFPYLGASALLGITLSITNFLLHSRWSFAPRRDSGGTK